MCNQGEELEGKDEEGKQRKIPEPVPSKKFGEWAEKQRKKKEAADKVREEEARKPQPPQQLKTPDEMTEEGLSGAGEKALAIPEWRLPAEQEEFALMSAADEKQIVLAELGQAPEDYLYCYPKGGKLVAGVSVTGAKDLAKLKGFIELLLPVDCHLEQGPDGEMYWHAGVRAKDIRKNTILPGFGRQWTKMKIKVKDPKTGEWTGQYDIIEDEYSWTKALGKATRNALLACLPSSEIKAYIDAHIREIAEKKDVYRRNR